MPRDNVKLIRTQYV